MYQNDPEEDKDKMFPGNSGTEYNFNYNAGTSGAGSNSVNSGYYGQAHQPQQPHQPLQSQPIHQQAIFSTGQMAGGPSSSGFGASSAFDNIDMSRNGNRFSSGTPFETVQEFVSVSNKVKWKLFIIPLHLLLYTLYHSLLIT